jgi:NAD+ synthase
VEVFGFTYDEIDDFLEGRAVNKTVSRAILDRYHAAAHERHLPTPPARAAEFERSRQHR